MPSRNKIHWLLYFQKTIEEFEISFSSLNSVKYDTSSNIPRGLIKVVCIVKSLFQNALQAFVHSNALWQQKNYYNNVQITVSSMRLETWAREWYSLLENLNEKLTFDAKNAENFTGSESVKKKIFFKVSLI